MKGKNIFNTLAFWNFILAFILAVIVAGLSCALIFYTKIFEKWDRTKVVRISDYDGHDATLIYIVDDVEYKNRTKSPFDRTVGSWLSKAVNGEIELYVDYLVSNPNHFMPHNTRRNTMVISLILWVAFAGMGTVGLIVINKKKAKKAVKKNES